MSGKPIAAGKSSFQLLNAQDLFRSLPLRKHTAILDVACGAGSYVLAMAEHLENEAIIYATDLWEEGLEDLSKAAAWRGLTSIRPILADLSQGLPLDAECLDLCLMATALHDLMQIQAHETALRELIRTLKPDGTLAVIEFQKIEPPPGPPPAIRLSPDELQAVLEPYGFRRETISLLDPYLYLSLQRLEAA